MRDIEIIEKIQLWKLDFFWKLYDKYVDEIYKFVYLKTTNKEVSEDIVSETFFSAMQNIDNFKTQGNANFRAWIYKIAYNKVINFYKIKDRNVAICEYLDLSLEEDIAKDIDNKNKLQEIQKYLDNIKKRDREVLIYRIWNDLSYKEIAEIMWISADNCKKIVSRTLKDISANFIFILFILILWL